LDRTRLQPTKHETSRVEAWKKEAAKVFTDHDGKCVPRVEAEDILCPWPCEKVTWQVGRKYLMTTTGNLSMEDLGRLGQRNTQHLTNRPD